MVLSLHWNPRVVMMTTLSSQVAPDVIIMTASIAIKLASWQLLDLGVFEQGSPSEVVLSNVITSSIDLWHARYIAQKEEYNCTVMFFGILGNPNHSHYNDVIMGVIASQITSLTVVFSTVYSDADQRKHQSSASLAFVRGIHRGPVNSSHKGPVTRKGFPFDDVFMTPADSPVQSTITLPTRKPSFWLVIIQLLAENFPVVFNSMSISGIIS